MTIKERIAKALFADVIEEEVIKATGNVFSHVEGLKTEEGVLIAKTLFGRKAHDFEKSSKQIVSQRMSLSPEQGILPDIDFEIFNQIYEQTSWVRAVVGVICKAVTARGWTLVPALPNPDPKNAEILTEFFLNCNPNDTFLDILDDITRDEYVYGNAFLEIVRGADGKPQELWNLDATTMRVRADEHANITGYVQVPRFRISGGGDDISFESNEVIHLKLSTKGATLYGLSPLASLILPVTVDKFAQIYNRAFFLNGAKVRGAFIMKDATPEQVERNREYLQARAKNPDTAHSDMVLEGQVEFKQIGVNQKDMEFLELREFTRNEILAVYGVPPSKVSIIETGNIGGGTGEHQDQTFYEETISPHQKRVAEKITKHIIRNGFGIRDWIFQFNRRAIDEKEQAEIFNIYLQNGVFSADEVRRLVAPRMPELEKNYGLIQKSAAIGRKQSIARATQAVVALENKFVNALSRVFRDVKKKIRIKLPTLKREALRSKAKSRHRPVQSLSVIKTGLALKRLSFQGLEKQIDDDLEIILELIDENDIARVLERYSLEAARKGLELAAERGDFQDIDEISDELDDKIKENAGDLAGHISLSLKDSIRQSLLEGLAANEAIPQLIQRIEGGLDRVAIVNVAAVTDDEGNIIRAATTREISSDVMAEIIARTESNRYFNEGNLDALQQAGVQSVRWLLADDACPECIDASEAQDGETLGKTLAIDDASDAIPVHPNCRCTWITEVEL